jgi:MFS family permease
LSPPTLLLTTAVLRDLAVTEVGEWRGNTTLPAELRGAERRAAGDALRRKYAQKPRTSPDFAWAFASRFMFLMAYAFLATYQAYYLLDKIGSARADVPQQIFLGTLVQSVVVIAASLIGGRLSDRNGRRKAFVFAGSVVYGVALFVIATASNFNGFLVGMAISGLGFGVYTAVDLALVVDVLPHRDNNAKDLGVFNIAGALPFSIAPAIAPAILAIGNGGYGLLYAVAGVCAVIGAVAIWRVKGVR